jgi:hypothetical protein
MVFPQVDCPRGFSRRRLIEINTLCWDAALITPQSAVLAGASTILGMLAPALIWESCAAALGVLKKVAGYRLPVCR